MRRVINLRGAIAPALLCVFAMMPLWAQNGAGALAGTVLDQAGKAISGAAVTAKGEGGSASGTATRRRLRNFMQRA